MKKIVLLIPNSLTISRIIMSILFAVNISKKLSIVVFFLICISDFLDGKIARMTGTTSILGAKLDIIADLFFIITSYVTLVRLKFLPLWFLVFICAKFMEFLLTSNFVRKYCSQSKHPFVFDKIGRIVSVMFFVVPGIACIFNIMMFDGKLYIIRLLLYTILAAGTYSSYLRIKNCFTLRRSSK